MATTRQYLSLLAVLGVGLAVGQLTPGAERLETARWPASDSVYAVPGWSMQPAVVENGYTAEQSLATLERTYDRPGQPSASLVIWTLPEPQAKTLLRKGPDRDFLGDGYISEPVSGDASQLGPGTGALVARRGRDAWLVLYAYGERRGLLDMGPLAWSAAEWDAFFNVPNDYFLARIMVPFDGALATPPAGVVAEASELADTLFPRLAGWYQALHDDPSPRRS